jgi:hypothetical protein
MQKISRTLVLIVGAVSVSGCQSILGTLGLADRPDSQQHYFGARDLEEGRAALAANLPGSAIPAFQRATLNPETAAAAYNGLGVAYARLQRGDLAERFFTQATVLDRENEAYANNLMMFYHSELAGSTRALAAREQEARQALAAAIVDPVENTSEVRTVANATITIERPKARLSQSTRREILVTTESRAEQPARNSQVASAAGLPHVGDARSGAVAPEYPIRIDISGKVPRSAPRAEYPIRITLPRVADAN